MQLFALYFIRGVRTLAPGQSVSGSIAGQPGGSFQDGYLDWSAYGSTGTFIRAGGFSRHPNDCTWDLRPYAFSTFPTS
jgi:hypothetical protein